MAADQQNFMDRAYRAEPARQLTLDVALQLQIEEQLGQG